MPQMAGVITRRKLIVGVAAGGSSIALSTWTGPTYNSFFQDNVLSIGQWLSYHAAADNWKRAQARIPRQRHVPCVPDKWEPRPGYAGIPEAGRSPIRRFAIADHRTC